jgi:hypothetical protein
MEERGWLTEGRTRRGTGDKATRVRETPYCIARSPSPIFQWLLLTFPSLSSAPSKTSISSSGPYFSISSPSPSQNPIQRPCRRLYSRSSHRLWLIFYRLLCHLSPQDVQSRTHPMCPQGSRPRQTSPGLITPSPEGNSAHVPFQAPKCPSCQRKLVGRP